MIFVISYDRKNRTATWLAEYPDECMAEAQQLRLRSEIELKETQSPREIVVLSAASKEILRNTHGRYFGPEALIEDLRKGASIRGV